MVWLRPRTFKKKADLRHKGGGRGPRVEKRNNSKKNEKKFYRRTNLRGNTRLVAKLGKGKKKR